MRNEIAGSSSPSRGQYVRCAEKYRLVYLRDPHFPGCDAAIFEQGVLYEEMGDRYRIPEDYRRAAKLYRFLISDYGGSHFCADALLRLGDLCKGPLGEREEALKAYQLLRTQYKHSKAASILATRVAGPRRKPPEPSPPPPSPAGVAIPPATQFSSGLVSSASQDPHPGEAAALVQNIRYWTTSAYTRVVIDMEGETRYQKTQLSNPDRLYFDISDAKLSHDLLNRKFAIGDDLLRQVRVAQNSAGIVRVVLDFAHLSDYSVFELHDPFRIIVDINEPRAASGSRQEADPSKSGGQGSKGSGDAAIPVPRRVEAPSHAVVAEAKTAGAEPATESSAVLSPQSEAAARSRSREESDAVTAGEGARPVPSVSGAVKPAPSTPASPTKVEGRSAKALDENSSRRAVKVESAGPSRIETTPSLSSTGTLKTQEVGQSKRASVTPPPVTRAEPAIPPKVAAPTSRGDRTLTRMLGLKIGRIVLDPGHGGHDFGTIGRGGLAEKNLVLEVARDLRGLLEEKLGAEVVLTRNDDSYLSLEERTAIANQHQADLFISIHANSSSVRSISGVETYYLDFARSAAEREVAARENATTERNVRDLENLVKKITLADKSAESRELAAIIQKKLYVGAQKLFPTARNRGVRRAPFVVLIGANMPSVLAEVAFISNPRDETLLKKGDNRERLAKALFAGIEGYMKTLASDVAQSHSGFN